jgi:Protein of unknown function (DUF3108)
MRSLVSIFTAVGLCAAAAFAQTVQKPAAPAPAAPKLTGFPFQDETLRYSVKWPSGLSLGDAVFTARHTQSGWNFENTIDAGVPGFAVKDAYRSIADADLCSLSLDRSFSHGAKKTREKTTFDQHAGRATRVTTLPENGGKTEIDIPSCARDALAFVYYARREMGQGRVAPEQKVFFGGGYSAQMRYTGEMSVRLEDQSSVTDHVVLSVKGPQSAFSVEVFFARDAARTPLVIKVPLSLGTLSVELVR